MTTHTPRWIDIGALDEIPVRGARVVKTLVGCIAVFRTGTNSAFAIEDKCPHKGGPLSQGIVHDTSVTCPLHNWVISLESGSALGADKGAVRTFALRIENARLYLDATTVSPAEAA